MGNQHEILASETLRRHCRYSTILGIAVWWTLFFAIQSWDHLWAITMFLLFVPLVLFRLSYPMLVPASPVPRRRAWYVVSYAQPPAAVCLAASFLFEPGTTASLFTLPWLAFSLFLAMIGLDRLLNFKPGEAGQAGPIVASLFLPVGAVWAYFARSGENPLGFSSTIVFLTAVHFHYAGFVLPILASQLVRFRKDRISRTLLVGVILAVPLVAIGITVTQLSGKHEVELVAAFALAILGLVMGVVSLQTAFHVGGWSGRFLAVSGASLLVALTWSAIYAAGQYGFFDGVTIPQMVYLHGAVNAVGFAFCGLIGWHLMYMKQSKGCVGGIQ